MGIKNKILFFLLIYACTAYARPVSYTDSLTFMTFSNNMKNSLYLHYSPSYKRSMGIEVSEDKMFNTFYGLFRYTQLVLRKNTKKSQANLYFNAVLGLNQTNNFSYGVQGDWETRKYFLGFKHNQKKFFGREFYEHYFMVGVVPYVGKYGDLHTWIMFKSKKESLTNDTYTYPVFKFFKGNSLLEIGFDNRERLDLYFVQRF